MKQRSVLAVAIIVAAALAGLVIVRFLTPEDTWLCKDGTWVKHGNPSAPMPEKSCGS